MRVRDEDLPGIVLMTEPLLLLIVTGFCFGAAVLEEEFDED